MVVGRNRGRRHGPVDRITLTLDGVFFADGGFAGPNRKGLWEQIVHSADTHMQVANIARQQHSDGVSPERILADIESVTGPSGDHAPLSRPPNGGSNPGENRESALQMLAWQIGSARKSQGDERTVLMLMAWGDAHLPQFHRL